MNKPSRRQLASTIVRMTSEGSNTRLAKGIAAYLIQTRRTKELESLARDCMQDRTERGVVEVTATSAFPLTTNAKDEIQEKVTGIYQGVKKVIINEVVNPGIVGGVRIESTDKQLDLSFRSRLDRLELLASSEGGMRR